jgi:hypothetical protein
MLPILATVGTGLAWFAATAGQLIFWGAGIAVGFHVGRKITGKWDQMFANAKGLKIFKRIQDEEAAAAVIVAQPAH